MAGILNTFLKQIFQGDTVKDWDHASKLFVASNYNLAPKNTFLYHVFFDLNPRANLPNQQKQIELGMLVKQASLPKFKIDVKSLNAYNRPNIVQNKIHYDPVNITFHDDSADTVRNFWFDYYAYYYRNSDYGGSSSLATYTDIHNELTEERHLKDWGYTIRGTTGGRIIKDPYLASIRIYSLFNKKFSEYILVNPFITSFQHGEHNSSATAEVMQHQMTVEYETVLYAHGNVSPNTVHGFADLHYDKRPSPLKPAGGGTRSIMGPGGIINSADEIIKDISSGNIAGAIFKAGRVGTTWNGANLGGIAAAEAISMTRNILSGNNPMGTVQIPTPGGLINGPNSKSSNLQPIPMPISSEDITAPGTMPPNLKLKPIPQPISSYETRSPTTANQEYGNTSGTAI